MIIMCNYKYDLAEKNELYQVYGICLSATGTDYFIISELSDRPSWYPADNFDIISNLFPVEWYFNFNGYNSIIHAIWGYKELVLDKNHHEALAEQEPEAIKIFNKRKKEIDEFEDFVKTRNLFVKNQELV